MKAKEALEQIKSLLFADEAPEVQTNEVITDFAEGVLADGTIVKFDKLEVGGMISVVTEEGEIPAPVGEHELEDGTIVVVSEPGMIAEVKMIEVEEDENEVEVVEEMAEEPINYDAKFAEISEAFNSKMTAIESKVDSLNEVTKKLIEFMEAFANVESAQETQAPKNTFLSQNRNEKKDAYKKLQNIFQTIKK